MKEIWRPIFGDGYSVSTFGRVKGKRFDHVLRPLLSTRPGYKKINYHGRDKSGCAFRRQYTIHELVALAFIGPRPNGAHIDHCDGNPLNNHVDNLEYVTPRENTRRATVMGRMSRGEERHNAVLTAVDVVQIRQGYGQNSEALAKIYGVTGSTIRRVIRRRTWKHL